MRASDLKDAERGCRKATPGPRGPEGPSAFLETHAGLLEPATAPRLPRTAPAPPVTCDRRAEAGGGRKLALARCGSCALRAQAVPCRYQRDRADSCEKASVDLLWHGDLAPSSRG